MMSIRRWLTGATTLCTVVLLAGLAVFSQEAPTPESRVIGKVTVDGEPLSGAEVVFEPLEKKNVGRECRQQTNELGKYSCRLPAGRYRLTILVDGRRIGSQEVDVAEGMGSEFDIPLTKEMLEPRDTGSLQERFDQANALMREGKYQQAVPIFEALLQDDPEQWAFHTQLAAAYAELDRPADAVEHYKKAIELRPGAASLHIDLAAVYARQGMVEKAEEEIETAARLEPDQEADAWFHLGRVLYHAGQMKAAVEPLRQTTELDPKRALAYYLLGICLYSQAGTREEGGQAKTILLPGTRESFERYLELAPEGRFADQARAMLQALDASATETRSGQ